MPDELWFQVFGWLLSIFTVVGNSLVMYLILTRRRLHTTDNYFIFSLAVADFGVGFTFFPSLYICDPFSPANSCSELVRWIAESFIVAASVTNLCTMTLEHYVVIERPLRYKSYLTHKNVVILITGAWVVTLLAHCLFALSFAFPQHKILFYIFDLVLFELLPVILLLCATGRIMFTIKKHSSHTAAITAQLKFNQRNGFHTRISRRDRELSTAKVIVAVVVVFAICCFLELYWTFCYDMKLCANPPKPVIFIHCLIYVFNSAVNPIAYAFLKRDIKRELKYSILCARKNPQRNSFADCSYAVSRLHFQERQTVTTL